MAITPELKQEFYKVLLDQTTPDTQSSILSNPNFVETKDTNYINVIVGFTNLVIVDLIDYKDVKLVFYNATEGSVIGVFDGQDNLIYQIDKHFTNQVSEPLYKFLGVKIDEKTGQIFGLNVVNDKTNFFLFNNIIELIGIVDNALIEAQQFYSTLFNVEDETTPSDAVKIGNKLFANIRTTPETIYGFNLDTQTSFAYSFVINDSDNKKVEFIQFETDLGQVNSNEATWNYNEKISLSQGGTGASTFDGISVLDVLTGERNISTTEQSLGSIAISTEKDSSASVEVPFSFGISNSSPLNENIQFPTQNINNSTTKLIANQDDFFNGWLLKIKDIINSNPASIDYNGILRFTSKIPPFSNKRIIISSGQAIIEVSGSSIEVNINKNFIDQLLNATKIELKVNITTIDADINEPKLTYKFFIELDDTIELFLFKDTINTLQASLQDYPLINTAFLYNISNGKITTAFFRDDVKFGFDLTEEITVEGKRLQTSLGANTTSQILIEKVKGNDKLIYKIIQEENNSYNGNSPVFLSAEKFYIPLKNRQTNSYYIAEFSGELRNPQPITKFYNDVGDKSYTDQGGDSYKRTLLSPKTITSVNVNGVDKPTSDYSLNGDIITVLGIKKGDIIIIEYISTTGQPKSISLDSSTAGEDVFIKGVSDADELGTLSRTIVGVGDDSFEGTQSNVFGFNLYRSTANVDYDKIAESTQSITDIKMKHASVSRQKDIIFFEGYNDDYSKVVKWLQIYPDSFKPYTYLPYSNPNKFFSLERLDVNKDNDASLTRFDREYLDVAKSGTTLIANTIAETTDLNNNDNNLIKIYGATNRLLFTFNQTILKTKLENLSINFQLTGLVEDNLQGNKDNQVLSNDLIELFTNQDTTFWEGFTITNLIIKYSDGTNLTTPATQYLRINGDKVTFEITLLKISDKTPTNLILKLKNGEEIANVDLTQNECLGGLENISFDIYIEDSSDLFQYVKYNETTYNLPYDPTTTKGGN